MRAPAGKQVRPAMVSGGMARPRRGDLPAEAAAFLADIPVMPGDLD